MVTRLKCWCREGHKSPIKNNQQIATSLRLSKSKNMKTAYGQRCSFKIQFHSNHNNNAMKTRYANIRILAILNWPRQTMPGFDKLHLLCKISFFGSLRHSSFSYHLLFPGKKCSRLDTLKIYACLSGICTQPEKSIYSFDGLFFVSLLHRGQVQPGKEFRINREKKIQPFNVFKKQCYTQILCTTAEWIASRHSASIK